jgi:hypothetical protein
MQFAVTTKKSYRFQQKMLADDNDSIKFLPTANCQLPTANCQL